jgi:hypothetical protein
MRALTRILTSIGLLVSASACTTFHAACLATDPQCSAAATFAETHVDNNEWDAVVAISISCDGYLPMSGGFEPEQCWRIELARRGDASHRKEAVIVLTTDNDFVRFGVVQTLSR